MKSTICPLCNGVGKIPEERIGIGTEPIELTHSLADVITTLYQAHLGGIKHTRTAMAENSAAAETGSNRLRSENEALRETLNDVEDMFNELQKENEHLKEIIKDMDGLMQSAKKEIKELKTENERLLKENEELTAILKELEKPKWPNR